jgi:hypothetical protein
VPRLTPGLSKRKMKLLEAGAPKITLNSRFEVPRAGGNAVHADPTEPGCHPGITALQGSRTVGN